MGKNILSYAYTLINDRISLYSLTLYIVFFKKTIFSWCKPPIGVSFTFEGVLHSSWTFAPSQPKFDPQSESLFSHFQDPPELFCVHIHRHLLKSPCWQQHTTHPHVLNIRFMFIYLKLAFELLFSRCGNGLHTWAWTWARVRTIGRHYRERAGVVQKFVAWRWGAVKHIRIWGPLILKWTLLCIVKPFQIHLILVNC